MTANNTGRKTLAQLEKDTSAIADLIDVIDPPTELTREMMTGLTDQQRYIARLKLRGLTQSQIGKLLNISQPAVSKHLKRINLHMQHKGNHVDQALKVGETTSIYDEVEARAWEIHVTTADPTEKMKSLQIVMQARERQTKLLMELGLLTKAVKKSQVDIKVSPLVESWQSGEAKAAVQTIIDSQLSKLDEPLPPEEDYIDALPTELDEGDDLGE